MKFNQKWYDKIQVDYERERERYLKKSRYLRQYFKCCGPSLVVPVKGVGSATWISYIRNPE